MRSLGLAGRNREPCHQTIEHPAIHPLKNPFNLRSLPWLPLPHTLGYRLRAWTHEPQAADRTFGFC